MSTRREQSFQIDVGLLSGRTREGDENSREKVGEVKNFKLVAMTEKSTKDKMKNEANT